MILNEEKMWKLLRSTYIVFAFADKDLTHITIRGLYYMGVIQDLNTGATTRCVQSHNFSISTMVYISSKLEK